jgi:hypothetical protein
MPTAVETKPAPEQAPPSSGSSDAGEAEKDAGAVPEGTADPQSSDTGVAPAM